MSFKKGEARNGYVRQFDIVARILSHYSKLNFPSLSSLRKELWVRKGTQITKLQLVMGDYRVS